ncbi:LAMI_0G04390g1_1 [Lachancea mirantina]|uniref:LAMI_0G04390g1_1 n=1 Tax=Lachancea mirantina TaxID=1230905 RepID=A0A1G4K8K4_9SACH|nr:LAMI_0G04390g1_1 [Lachancea mirantina]
MGSPQGLNDDSESESAAERRSASLSGRANYQIEDDGVEIKDDDDDEDYKEDAPDDEELNIEDGDDEDYEEGKQKNAAESPQNNSNQKSAQTHGRRGRPPKRKTVAEASATSREVSSTNSVSVGPANIKKPRLGFPVDDDGNALPVVNDEFALPDDVEGEAKITKDGDLLGGRQFLVRTFTVYTRGPRKFMLSTEPARAVGFRDSYLFFQYHPNLYKFVISQDERNDLIDRGILPYSYRSRTIALVAARSVFKEFGAKIIADGRYIIDDYYATRLREEGRVIEGAYAREPVNKGDNKNGLGLGAQASTANPARNAVEFFDKKNHNIPPGNNISSTNWLYQHAAVCSRFNSDLFYDRERVLLIEHLGLRDPYTNTLHIPQSTQPTKVINYQRSTSHDKSQKIVYETIITDSDLTKRRTGLQEVPLEVFEDVVDENLKEAILAQQRFESSK